MSSTNGKAAKVDPTQFYETPGWVLRAILPFLPREGVKTLVDLGCGRGALGVELRKAYPKSKIVGFESDFRRAKTAWGTGAYDEVHRIDLLSSRARLLTREYHGADIAISNPPFRQAVEFAELAFEMVAPNEGQLRAGQTAILQRDAWLSCMKRLAFARKHPCDKYILPRRPSFTGNGRSDSATYAWHLYGGFFVGRWYLLDVEPVPKAPKRKRIS
jgi:hypothetical protein